MQLIQNILSANQILTASLLSWFVAQVLKTIINFILLGKFQLERMWGDGGMPSARAAATQICGAAGALAITSKASVSSTSPASIAVDSLKALWQEGRPLRRSSLSMQGRSSWISE